MALRLSIVSRHGPKLGSTSVKEFGPDGGTIGRSLECNWVLPDTKRYLSSRHASIDFRSGSYYIVDTSTNGVYVNDAEQPVGRGKPQRLFGGDRVRIGEYEMSVEIDEDPIAPLIDENHVDPVDIAQRVEAPEPTGNDLVDAYEITGVGIEMMLTDDELETLTPPTKSKGAYFEIIDDARDPRTPPAPDSSQLSIGGEPADTVRVLASRKKAPAAGAAGPKNGGTAPARGPAPAPAPAPAEAQQRPANVPVQAKAQVPPQAQVQARPLVQAQPRPQPQAAPAATRITTPASKPGAPQSARAGVAAARAAAHAPMPTAAPAAAPAVAPTAATAAVPTTAATAVGSTAAPTAAPAAAPTAAPTAASTAAPTVAARTAAAAAVIHPGTDRPSSSPAAPDRPAPKAAGTARQPPKPTAAARPASTTPVAAHRPSTAAASPAAAPAVAPPTPLHASGAQNLDPFFRGAGLAIRVPPQQIDAFLFRLGQVMNAMIVGVTENLHVRAQQKNALKLDSTTIQSQDNNPLKLSATVEEAFVNLFLRDSTAHLPAAEAVREAFDDVKLHQQLLLKAVQDALDAFVARLDPDELEHKFARGRSNMLVNAANRLKYWDFYKDLYDVVAHHPPGELPVQFLEDFGEAYERELEQAMDETTPPTQRRQAG